MKPTLVVACSGKKLPTTSPLVCLYQGNFWKTIRKEMPRVHLYALSAKLGLQEAALPFAPYDQTLPRTGFDKTFIELLTTQVRGTIFYSSDLFFCGGWNYYAHLKRALPNTAIYRLPNAPRGNGDMQKALKTFCKLNQTDDWIPQWHSAVQRHCNG